VRTDSEGDAILTVEYNIGMDFQTSRLFDHYFRRAFYIEKQNGSPFFAVVQKNMAAFNTI